MVSTVQKGAILGGLLYMTNPQIFFIAAKTGVFVFVLLLLFLLWKQDSMLYIPNIQPNLPSGNKYNPKMYRSPSEWNIPFRDVLVKTVDGVDIHGWLLYHREEAKRKQVPTIVYFHGNAGNVGTRLPLLHELLNEVDCNVLAMDYRGYGDSNGHPTESGLRLDAAAVLDFLCNHPDIDNDNVVVFGRSLGGAVAIALTSESRKRGKVVGLIVENSFTSVVDIAVVLMPFLSALRPILHPPLLRNHWKSVDVIASIDCPILFISGAEDELIPPKQMAELYAKCSDNKSVTFKSIPNGKHNSTPLDGGPDYYRAINTFVSSLPKRAPAAQVGSTTENGENEYHSDDDIMFA